MKDLRQGFPPFAGGSVSYRLLHRFGDRPPLTCLEVLSHPRHVGCEVVADVFKVGKEQGIVPEDRIIANMAGPNHLQHFWPHMGVDLLIIGNLLGFDTDNLPVSPHTYISFRYSPAMLPPKGVYLEKTIVMLATAGKVYVWQYRAIYDAIEKIARSSKHW